ncbi:hypothetical protein O6H91_12G098700 [Diphasiastrum complanatum]|uniref:Uncharacterized protein n=1 Tax=Diphasiastrum complanatum TaxID=34168 RepID=A0ACC2C540_DIPCM|nr:hypothetical protein O6H91_12G098700 [Diphasiastrum complanatum]
MQILPKLSIQTLRNLLTSDELWVPSEEKRFELALSVLVARGGLLELNTSHVSMALEAESAVGTASASLSSIKAQEQIQATKVDGCNFGSNTGIEGSKVQRTASSEKPIDQVDVNTLIQSTILELADSLVAMQVDDHACLGEKEQPFVNQQLIYVYGSEKYALTDKFESAENTCEITKPQLCKNTDVGHGEACATNELAVEGSSIGHMSSDDFWSYRDHAGHCSFSSQPSTSFTARSSSTQSRDGSYTSPSWGGRVVERRLMKAYPTNAEYTNNDDWEAFISVFEGGGILYCHMAFEDLLNMRGQLEELGFPCKSVADGLWLQTLLRQQVLTIAADTCKNCCYVYPSCNCRQGLVYPHTRIPASNYHRDDQERNTRAASMGSYPLTDAQGGVNGSLQGRVHVRGTMDGLAGIGRGTTFGPPGTPWPSSRFVFSRVPIGGHSNRCSQQNVGNDQVNGRFELGAVDLPTQCANGLTAVVGLTQGLNSSIPLHSDQSGRLDDQPLFSRVAGEPPGGANLSNANVFKVDSQEQTLGQEWEACQGSSISLDLQTPLRNFPPFRFGVEFDDVHRLADGQSKHSPEAFYAGSLWKVSVQAFNDEDPRGRRTLGLFLHRRKADEAGPYRKVSLYTDSREKVKARYQLICPAKRGVMILGNLTQAGTLLPKAPKGWGWRTAFLFDELADLLQGSSLRVAAVVQIV